MSFEVKAVQSPYKFQPVELTMTFDCAEDYTAFKKLMGYNIQVPDFLGHKEALTFHECKAATRIMGDVHRALSHPEKQ